MDLVISDLNGEEIVGTSYEKKLKETNQKEVTAGKSNKEKSDKQYVNWKEWNSLFNSWIYKKDIVQMSEYFPGPRSSGGRDEK